MLVQLLNPPTPRALPSSFQLASVNDKDLPRQEVLPALLMGAEVGVDVR